MLRHFPYRIGMACLILATMFASSGSASRAHVKSAPLDSLLWIDFASMNAKGDVSVDDAVKPSTLAFDLKSSFRLGLKSDGLNPLTENFMLQLQYGSAVGPMYIVAAPGGCFTQVGKSFFLRMQDMQNCKASVRFESAQQSPNEILPYIELLPYMEKLELRLTPGPKDQWDLKVNIDFMASSNEVRIDGVIAILKSPWMVKLAIGNNAETGDGGAVTIGSVGFRGDTQ